MVLILDKMVTQDALRTGEGTRPFYENHFYGAVDVQKCLKQIKSLITLYMWAHISELPS